MNAPTLPRFSMDLMEPYGVYVDGICVAEYDDEDEAAEHFIRLRRSAS